MIPDTNFVTARLFKSLYFQNMIFTFDDFGKLCNYILGKKHHMTSICVPVSLFIRTIGIKNINYESDRWFDNMFYITKISILNNDYGKIRVYEAYAGNETGSYFDYKLKNNVNYFKINITVAGY